MRRFGGVATRAGRARTGRRGGAAEQRRVGVRRLAGRDGGARPRTCRCNPRRGGDGRCYRLEQQTGQAGAPACVRARVTRRVERVQPLLPPAHTRASLPLRAGGDPRPAAPARPGGGGARRSSRRRRWRRGPAGLTRGSGEPRVVSGEVEWGLGWRGHARYTMPPWLPPPCTQHKSAVS